MTAQNEPLDIDPRFTNSEGVVRAIEKKRNKIMQNEHKPTYEQKRYQMGAQAVPALQNEPQLSAEQVKRLKEWWVSDGDEWGLEFFARELATALEEQKKAVLAEVESWLVDEDLSEHENDRQCPECSAMWHYDHAKSRNTVRAELRAKLEEMREGK